MFKKICNSLVAVLLVLAVSEVNGATCLFLTSQPKVPKVLQK